MQKYKIIHTPSGKIHTKYPLYITSVKHSGRTKAKYPNGWLMISGYDQRYEFFAKRKCVISKRDGKRYCIFGAYRLNEGYKGPVHLIGVPEKDKEMVRAKAVKYGATVE